jgi:lysophospholipase L1-like esterase
MQAQAKSLGVPYIDFINLPLFDQSNNGQHQLSNGHPTRLGSSHIAKQLLTAIAALK